MKRWIIFSLVMLLLSCSSLFAGNLFGESTSEESWVLEHSSVNNDNKYWDVMVALSSGAPNQEYSAAATNELLRIRTNYGRDYTDNKYRKVTITPEGGSWIFTSDYNATVTRAYSFDLYEIAWTRSGARENAVASGSPTKINPGTNTSAEYSFTMKSAEWSTLGTDYAKKFYDYEIVLRLPELTQTERERLEPGDYHASFTVSLYTGSSGGSVVSHTYTIKAVYGESSGANAAEYSFSILEADSTYNVDLTKTNQYFAVAEINFHAVGLSTENRGKTQIENSYKNKYKILISPYSQYDLDDTSDENPYYFVLNGTDNLPRSEINTVWYTLASNSSGTALSLYNSNTYKHTYVITPSLDVSGKERNWVLTWDLSQTVYIKPTAVTTAVTRANGFYRTTLYFYVVTNT